MKSVTNKDKVRKIILFFLAGFIMMGCLWSVFSEELMDKEAILYLKQGIEAQKQGDLDYAISLYTKAIYANSSYLQAYNNRGTAYAQKGDIVKAEEEYDKAIMIDPHYSTALLNKAIIYAERKNWEKFLEYWERAEGLDIYAPFIIDEED
ncbi:tetratricopeptide repeat protein [Candidatus Omnitrophota bacterium]